MVRRCAWSGFSDDPLMLPYHDEEWGVPVHKDRTLFEFLILEGAQAGLSWQTILNKRENYRKAFDKLDPAKVAKYNQSDVKRLLANPGIVRNRLKIRGDNHKREETVRSPERVRLFQQVHLEIRRWQADQAWFHCSEGDSGDDEGVGCDEQGPSKERIQLRGTNNLLRFHAGRRNGQRSQQGMFQVQESMTRQV